MCATIGASYILTYVHSRSSEVIVSYHTRRNSDVWENVHALAYVVHYCRTGYFSDELQLLSSQDLSTLDVASKHIQPLMNMYGR